MLPVLAGLAYLAMLPQARADVMYDFTVVTISSTSFAPHVTFVLPTFMQDTGDVTSFIEATSREGTPITRVHLDGGAGSPCTADPTSPAPCEDVLWSDSNELLYIDARGISFDALGTFTSARGDTLTISTVAGVPEPGSVILLLSVIAAVALVFGKRSQPRNSPALEP
jgi:hypothetical protein